MAKRTAPFGYIKLDASWCTGCGHCPIDCPTEALGQERKEDTYSLTFRPDDCKACGLCVDSCPEKALQLEPVREVDKLSQSPRVIFEDPIAYCAECGAPLFTQAMIAKVRAKIVSVHDPLMLLALCLDCRIKRQLEKGNIARKKDQTMIKGQGTNHA